MDPVALLSLEEIIAGLADVNRPLLYTVISELSDLNKEELRRLEQVWTTIDLKRRRQILRRMVETAEHNAVLNFDEAFKLFLKDGDAEVRSLAIEGLWESEDPFLIAYFIRFLSVDNPEQVQSAAAIALGKFALLAELGKLRPHYLNRVAAALISALEDRNRPVEVRRRILEAAAPLNLPQVRKAITEAYQDDSYECKISAIYAMGQSCDPSWLPILLQELESSDSVLRYEAAGACGELGAEAAVPYLAELVTDPDLDVRLAAIQALGKIGGSEAKSLLEDYADAAEEAVREAVEQALGELEFAEDPLSFKLP